ncbi:ATPase PAAT-like [Saccostrea echinata]|uniref:ATPase PAAT-like n=1 Tax=Saccostrea echinata TaxID=191078 RepID=UPI002A836912|nr:ATPase PAAT-like [Saccostrea echinata]
MAGIDYCTVLPSWDFDKDPATIVEYYFGQEFSSQTDDNDDDGSGQQPCQDINPRNFLQLSSVEGEEVCTMTLTCKPQYHISICGLHVYSQARLVEIYDASEGYLKTVRGQRMRMMGDDEGGEDSEVVYKCRTSLDTCYGLTIKFPRVHGVNFFKIFKVVFILHPEPEEDYGGSGGQLGQINMSKVKSYVTSLGDNIPEGARGLMQSMEEFQQNQRASMTGIHGFLGQQPSSAGSPLGMMGLMSMLSQMGIRSNQLPGKTNNSQSHLNNLSQKGIRSNHLPEQTNSNQSHSSNLSQQRTQDQSGNSNESDSSDVFSLLHNICDRVSGMRAEEKRKMEEAEETKRREAEKAKEEKLQIDIASENTTDANIPEEMRNRDTEVSPGSSNSLNTKLEDLEQRLLSHVDSKLSEMEKRINSRLDEILKLLQSDCVSTPES